VSAKNADVRIMSASNPQLLGLDTTDICIDDSSVVSSSGLQCQQANIHETLRSPRPATEKTQGTTRDSNASSSTTGGGGSNGKGQRRSSMLHRSLSHATKGQLVILSCSPREGDMCWLLFDGSHDDEYIVEVHAGEIQDLTKGARNM
jgi:hypothetical protein